MDPQTRDRLVRRNLVLEGAANLAVLALKLAVGLATGSIAILGDALHSLADVGNNVVAFVVTRRSSRPPDHDHPYGHRKFETLAVFFLGVLLAALALQVGARALSGGDRVPVADGWSLALMLLVLATNTAIATWQGHQARKLDSPILQADARHTAADVLTTIVVIIGWRAGAAGHAWVDAGAALLVAGIVLWLAWGLFRRSVPILVDAAAVPPDELRHAVHRVEGVRAVRAARSRQTGDAPAIDVAIGVDGALSTEEAHAIADAVEAMLRRRFGARDVVVHVEPHGGAGRSG